MSPFVKTLPFEPASILYKHLLVSFHYNFVVNKDAILLNGYYLFEMVAGDDCRNQV